MKDSTIGWFWVIIMGMVVASQAIMAIFNLW